MTRVALLWHMHQPYYEDLVSGEHMLPWVRLHALKDYWGMVTLLEEFPDVRLTFNLVPSLLVQLEAFAQGRARDRYLELGSKPADALSRDDVRFILKNFFHAQRHRMIEAYPRYSELLALRGWETTESDIEFAVRRFTVDDLRDLQVWQKLAWIDPDFQNRDSRVRGLIERGRGFTEDDKVTLRTIELELLNAVIPAYRQGMAAGNIELSTSPFYHPILPLLCDTDVYTPASPGQRPLGARFARPDDALAQLEQASDYFERLFGRRPVGLWPSEGSVSDAMVPLVARAGFEWMATDELVLAHTLGIGFQRGAGGRPDHADRLYRPYVVSAGGAEVRCGFRDHALSDLIGFVYAGWPAEAAADDFVRKLVEAGREATARGAEAPTVFVILDGENAWEHFDGGGRPFLRALYGRLASHPELETVTMGEACASARDRLNGIFAGSWIDASFYIWIGHPDDQRAWTQVGDARRALDGAGPQVPPDRVARARQELFIAEGSDWCWWYGDDHSSDHDAEFDELFRRHLRNVYRLLDKPVPDQLFVSNITAQESAVRPSQPLANISPIVDGEDTSYFEWRSAGLLEITPLAGAMHQVDRQPMIAGIRFGCDDRALFLRVDTAQDASTTLRHGWSLAVHFVRPAGIQLVCRLDGDTVRARMQRVIDSALHDLPDAGLEAAAGSLLELRIPFEALGGSGATGLAFFVAASHEGHEVERYPASRPIELNVPEGGLTAFNWSA